MCAIVSLQENMYATITDANEKMHGCHSNSPSRIEVTYGTVCIHSSCANSDKWYNIFILFFLFFLVFLICYNLAKLILQLL